jgi:hypothetical protein
LRDEIYILNLCDEVLSRKALRQHRFDFLKGDSGRKLPVDAYYEDLKLVIEYRERQHSESVSLFDKRMTVSGISRGEQRAKYDELRRQKIPQEGFNLVELCYFDFSHNTNKRLKQDKTCDIPVIQKKLRQYLCVG